MSLSAEWAVSICFARAGQNRRWARVDTHTHTALWVQVGFLPAGLTPYLPIQIPGDLQGPVQMQLPPESPPPAPPPSASAAPPPPATHVPDINKLHHICVVLTASQLYPVLHQETWQDEE